MGEALQQLSVKVWGVNAGHSVQGWSCPLYAVQPVLHHPVIQLLSIIRNQLLENWIIALDGLEHCSTVAVLVQIRIVHLSLH